MLIFAFFLIFQVFEARLISYEADSNDKGVRENFDVEAKLDSAILNYFLYKMQELEIDQSDYLPERKESSVESEEIRPQQTKKSWNKPKLSKNGKLPMNSVKFPMYSVRWIAENLRKAYAY